MKKNFFLLAIYCFIYTGITFAASSSYSYDPQIAFQKKLLKKCAAYLTAQTTIAPDDTPKIKKALSAYCAGFNIEQAHPSFFDETIKPGLDTLLELLQKNQSPKRGKITLHASPNFDWQSLDTSAASSSSEQPIFKKQRTSKRRQQIEVDDQLVNYCKQHIKRYLALNGTSKERLYQRIERVCRKNPTPDDTSCIAHFIQVCEPKIDRLLIAEIKKIKAAAKKWYKKNYVKKTHHESAAQKRARAKIRQEYKEICQELSITRKQIKNPNYIPHFDDLVIAIEPSTTHRAKHSEQ